MVSPAAGEVATNKLSDWKLNRSQYSRGRRRQSPEQENDDEIVRYFLSKAGSNGGISSLEKEIATEGIS